MHAAELVEVLFPEHAVLAEREPVVAAKDDDRILPLPAGLQLGENTPDVMVETGDTRIVVSGLPLRVFRRARPGSELLITHGHFAVVEGMLRHERWRERNSAGIIKFVKLRLGGAWIVGNGWCQIDIEWSDLM